MRLQLQREHGTKDWTFGSLSCDGVFECYVLEDEERPVKIPKITAIPCGTYEISRRYSPHFGCVLPWLLDVPGYEYVLMHKGNKPADTDGCLIVGDAPSRKQGWLGKSGAAFDRLIPKIFAALDRGESVWIDIS